MTHLPATAVHHYEILASGRAIVHDLLLVAARHAFLCRSATTLRVMRSSSHGS
ncbi:PucR family transcriptional regulator [Sesbania bispinosa]|nr:PucR family transcriptional regulator [Sesbania bispinosa]